jgi:pyrimidine deaminase RibD-like protein
MFWRLLPQVSALSSQLYELQVVSEKRLAAAAAEGQAVLRAEQLELQVGCMLGHSGRVLQEGVRQLAKVSHAMCHQDLAKRCKA